MQVNKINLVHFRSYDSLYWEPSPFINFVYGENAQGKTNLLEGIYYLLSGHSFRTRQERELLQEGTSFFYLQGEISTEKSKMKQLVKIYGGSSSAKKIMVNEDGYNKEDYMVFFPAVIFYPEDLGLIKEGPLIRRKYLNREITRWQKGYWPLLKNYYRALKQRNSYLKGYSISQGNLQLWNEALSKYGSKIVFYRLLFLKKLEKEFAVLLHRFTDGEEEVSVSYRSSIVTGDIFQRLEEENYPSDLETELENSLYERIYGKIKEKEAVELKKGYSLVGPHVDEFRIYLNGRDAQKYASQGQQRTITLSLKLAQFILHRKQGSTPVLLLDDLFSELDHQRRSFILHFIQEEKMQCFVTSFEKEWISSFAGFPLAVYKLQKGALELEDHWEFA